MHYFTKNQFINCQLMIVRAIYRLYMDTTCITCLKIVKKISVAWAVGQWKQIPVDRGCIHTYVDIHAQLGSREKRSAEARSPPGVHQGKIHRWWWRFYHRLNAVQSSTECSMQSLQRGERPRGTCSFVVLLGDELKDPIPKHSFPY